MNRIPEGWRRISAIVRKMSPNCRRHPEGIGLQGVPEHPWAFWSILEHPGARKTGNNGRESLASWRKNWPNQVNALQIFGAGGYWFFCWFSSSSSSSSASQQSQDMKKNWLDQYLHIDNNSSKQRYGRVIVSWSFCFLLRPSGVEAPTAWIPTFPTEKWILQAEESLQSGCNSNVQLVGCRARGQFGPGT